MADELVPNVRNATPLPSVTSAPAVPVGLVSWVLVAVVLPVVKTMLPVPPVARVSGPRCSVSTLAAVEVAASVGVMVAAPALKMVPPSVCERGTMPPVPITFKLPPPPSVRAVAAGSTLSPPAELRSSARMPPVTRVAPV